MALAKNMKRKLLILSILVVLIAGFFLSMGFRRSLRITFNGEVIEGAKVYMLSSNGKGLEILEIGEGGIIEPTNGFSGDYFSIKVVQGDKVMKDCLIGPLKYGKHYYDFRGEETYHERKMFFYSEISTSHPVSDKQLKEFLKRHPLPDGVNLDS